jgi:hypothetical protein
VYTCMLAKRWASQQVAKADYDEALQY